jgi:hypothetical protein
MHHEHPIGGAAYVQLHGIGTKRDRRLKRCGRVLRRFT